MQLGSKWHSEGTCDRSIVCISIFLNVTIQESIKYSHHCLQYTRFFIPTASVVMKNDIDTNGSWIVP